MGTAQDLLINSHDRLAIMRAEGWRSFGSANGYFKYAGITSGCPDDGSLVCYMRVCTLMAPNNFPNSLAFNQFF